MVHHADIDTERAREAGFDHHVVKPVDPATVRDLIARRTSPRVGQPLPS